MAETQPASSPASAARPTNVRFGVLAVLCSLSFLTYLDRICIMRVQDDIARDLNFGGLTEADERELAAAGRADDPAAREKARDDRERERMSWVFSAFLLGYVLFEIPGGWLGDVWGARSVIVRIVVWWSLFTALTGSVDALVGLFVSRPGPAVLVASLVAIRFLFGMGEAGAYPNIGRVLGRWFPSSARASAQGAVWFASRLGGAGAPLIIGTLMEAAGGWRNAFWILGAIGMVWAAGFWLWFRDRPEEMPAVNRAEADLIRGGASAGSIYDDSHHTGVPWLRLIFSTNLLAIYVAAASVSFSWYFYVTFLPKYLDDRFHVDFQSSELMSGLPLLVGGMSCLLGGLLSDRLIRITGSRRWGRSLIGFAGYAVAGVCALVIARLDSPWAVIAAMCVACAFQDLAIPCIWSLPADVGGRYAGTVGGCMNSLGAVGGFFSPLVAARVANAHGWDTVFYVFAASYLLGALAWLRINAAEPLAVSSGPAGHFTR